MLGKILARRTATTAPSPLVGLIPTVAPILMRSLRRHPIPTALGLAGAAVLFGALRNRHRLQDLSSKVRDAAREKGSNVSLPTG